MPPESILLFCQGQPLLTCPPVLQRGHLAGWFQVGGSGAWLLPLNVFPHYLCDLELITSLLCAFKKMYKFYFM